MPNDLTISGVRTPFGSTESVEPAQPSGNATIEPARSGSALPNPTLRLDAALGIVVIEFRNTSGEIANSIPTQQQLEAYRLRLQSTSSRDRTREPAAAATAEQPPAKTGGGIVA
jgi:hypothetical protein